MVDSLREAIEEEFVVEKEGWAYERVTRVTDQLQRDALDEDRFETIVFWSDEHTAFTGPGRTIYFSRRLLERMPDDDAAAFVIAHELAHHRLGHVPSLTRSMVHLPIRIAIRILSRWIEGKQHEADADLLAIEMCIDAGYDLDKCLHALEQLAIVSLDYGDVDGVLGPDEDSPRERRSHPALQHRIAAARIHAGRLRQYGYRLQIDLEERRKARRRRIAIAAGAAAAGVALLLIRRR